MKASTLLLMASLAVAPIAAAALSPLDGNFWHEKCTGESASGQLACMAFVHGIAMGANGQAAISKVAPAFCLPPNSNNRQLNDVFSNYLTAHPEVRHIDGSVLAFRSLADAFPCDRTKK